MRSLYESLFDIDDNIDNVNESIKDQINQFLNDNFTNASKCKISDKLNKDGKFEVSSNEYVGVKNKHITSLTNGLFIWTSIKGDFDCSDCNSLKSLEGSPKEVGGNFNCDYCNSLISLKGASEEVGGTFSCEYCNSLTSLEGAPEEVGRDFYCNYCTSLISLKPDTCPFSQANENEPCWLSPQLQQITRPGCFLVIENKLLPHLWQQGMALSSQVSQIKDTFPIKNLLRST